MAGSRGAPQAMIYTSQKIKMKKILYIIVRTLSIFGMPPISKIRNIIYSWRFQAEGIKVSDRVLITTAHRNIAAYIKIGKALEMGRDSYIDYSGGAVIGNNVAISEGAKIFTHNHAINDGHSNWHKNPIEFSSITIDDDVWIGASSIILPKVKYIAQGSIIAAGAVLTSDTEKFGVYAGNPARKIAERRIDESKN